MSQSPTVSEILRGADSFSVGISAMLAEYPAFRISDLMSVACAELVELGWAPDEMHPDCAYLLGLVSILRPIYAEHGDQQLADAVSQLGF